MKNCLELTLVKESQFVVIEGEIVIDGECETIVIYPEQVMEVDKISFGEEPQQEVSHAVITLDNGDKFIIDQTDEDFLEFMEDNYGICFKEEEEVEAEGIEEPTLMAA